MPGQRKSIRLKDYDYSQEGAYFITICVKNRKCLFGDICDGEMVLNECGKIIDKYWNQIPEHFPHVELDEYIVMPNHVHGVIIIGKRVDLLPDEYIETLRRGTACRAPTMECFGKPVPGSLSTIIRSFKSAATKQINMIRNTAGIRLWQRNYYEHIIRNGLELNRIRQYIVNNPVNWEKDRYYSG